MRITVAGGLAVVLLVGAASVLPPLGEAPEAEARVVRVSDGDSLTVRVGGGPEESIRLVEIDAPESRQPYGAAATRELSRRVVGQTVRLDRQGQDRYGRTLARVWCKGEDVNKAMVRAGAAWVYTAYATDDAFVPLQAEARAERVGLWAQPSAEVVAPWEWRRGEGRPAPTRPPPVTFAELEPNSAADAPAALVCRPRPTCGRMASCEDARFHLTECSADRLDGDGDGTPCEALCG